MLVLRDDDPPGLLKNGVSYFTEKSQIKTNNELEPILRLLNLHAARMPAL
jgi:hypothetical protein